MRTKTSAVDAAPMSKLFGAAEQAAFARLSGDVNPMHLDAVLPKVVAGTWAGKFDAEAVEKTEEDFDKAFRALQGPDAEADAHHEAQEHERGYHAESGRHPSGGHPDALDRDEAGDVLRRPVHVKRVHPALVLRGEVGGLASHRSRRRCSCGR